MPQKVSCPRCSKHFLLPDQAGPSVACPYCGSRLSLTPPVSTHRAPYSPPPVPVSPPINVGFPFSLGWKGGLAAGLVIFMMLMIIAFASWPKNGSTSPSPPVQNANSNPVTQVKPDDENSPLRVLFPGQKEVPTNPEKTPLKGTLVEFVTTQGDKFKLASEHDPWADAVVSFQPGTPAPTQSMDPRGSPGKPDYKGTDDAEDEKRYVALGHGGVLVLEFKDNVIFDGPNDDLVVFEIGPAVEPTEIAISEDGLHWVVVGRTSGGKSSLDIGPFVKPDQRFRYVRLTDSKAALSNNSAWPGADIDAVGALNSLPVEMK